MKQLFLCSYFAGVKDLFRQYASEKQLGNQVLFIHEALQTFEDLGFQVEVLDISACDRETAQAKIFQNKLLYVSGGNTFYLLQELKKKELLFLIKEQIADDMVYVGESAGAVITAEDIDYIRLMDDKEVAGELSDTVALHEADFYLLPHVGEEPFAESAQAILNTYGDKLNLLPLNNRQAVLVEDEEVKVLVENK